MRQEPLNWRLNDAVQTLANRLFPAGYDVSETAPDSLEGLTAEAKARGRITVYRGASDNTIFASPGINHDFRAWHDWAHLRYQLPFNPEGERAAAYVQVAHVVRLYGDDEDAVEMAALILTAVIGQAEWYGSHGGFPADQRAFALTNARRFKPLAQSLVHDFGLTEASDRDAIRRAMIDGRQVLVA